MTVKYLPTFDGKDDSGQAIYGRPYISASSLLMYLDCAHKWFLRYVMKEKRPLSWKAEFGNVFHATIEDDLNHVIQNGCHLPHSDLYKRYAYHLDQKILSAGMSRDLIRDYGTIDAAVEGLRDEGNALIGLYLTDPQAAPRLRPKYAELEFRWQVDEEYDLKGKIDEVDEGAGDGEEVNDFKTTSSDRPLDAERWLAGTTYAAIRFEQTGQLPKKVRLIRFNRRARTPFIDTAEAERTLDDIEDLRKLIRTAVRLIQKDLFPPDGLTSGACRWCDYRYSCEPRRAYLEANLAA